MLKQPACDKALKNCIERSPSSLSGSSPLSLLCSPIFAGVRLEAAAAVCSDRLHLCLLTTGKSRCSASSRLMRGRFGEDDKMSVCSSSGCSGCCHCGAGSRGSSAVVARKGNMLFC